MSDGADKNYKEIRQKNNWRRWAWNRIEDCIVGSRLDAKILYLAGESNLDAREAVRRGFRAENMIAVERDAELCSHLRSISITTVNMDLSDAIRKWGGEKVDVVVADLCCGITVKTMSMFLWATLQPCFKDCVFSVNLLRGREAFPEQFRDEMLNLLAANNKHRANVLIDSIKNFTERNILGFDLGNVEAEELPHLSGIANLGDFICERMRAKTSSYKSNRGLVFDSCVYLNPSYHWARLQNEILRRYKKMITPDGRSETDSWLPEEYEQFCKFCKQKATEEVESVNHKPETHWPCKSSFISAAKATRNRKINAFARN